jgi:hypothetical protein
MDVYGGVSLSDPDAARSGGWKNWSYASTAVDGSFSTTFPMGKVLGRGATLADSNLAVFPTRDELLVVDPRNGQVVNSTPAVGKISRRISSQLR